MFGESPRECSAATSPGGGLCYRILRCQSLGLLVGQLKTEILREASLVALHGFIEAKGRDRIEPGEGRPEGERLKAAVKSGNRRRSRR